MSPLEQHFLTLVRSGLREQPAEVFPQVLPLPHWQAILDMARKQTVTGLVFRGVGLLPDEVQVPDNIMFSLMMEAERIKRQSALVSETAAEVCARFEAAGLHPVVLKGPEVARLYPDPSLRESGDIDLYFSPEEFEKACAVVRAEGRSLAPASDGSVHYDWNGIDIDQHRQYFDLHTRKGLPPVPSAEATLLMLSVHILKHCMGAGIGLRQFCDMAAAYRSVPYDREKLLACYKATGTARWNRLLAAFLERYLGAATPYSAGDPVSPVTGAGEPLPDPDGLLAFVLAGGNFGHHDAAREKVLKEGGLRRKADTLLRFLRRLPFSLRYAPREWLGELTALARGNLRPE